MTWIWIFLFPLIPLVIVFGIMYMLDRRMLGRAAASEKLRQVCLSICIAFILVIFLLILGSLIASRGYLINPFLLFFIPWFAFLAYLATWPWRKKRAGSLLLDAGRTSQQKLMCRLGLLQLVCAIWLTIHSMYYIQAIGKGWRPFPGHDLFIMYIWSGVAYSLLMGMSRLEIRENGLCYMAMLMHWKHIKYYQWDKQKTNVLMIRCRAGSPFFWNYTLSIPPHHREAVQHLLREYLPDKNRDVNRQPF